MALAVKATAKQQCPLLPCGGASSTQQGVECVLHGCVFRHHSKVVPGGECVLHGCVYGYHSKVVLFLRCVL
jgi:hypothetical protein